MPVIFTFFASGLSKQTKVGQTCADRQHDRKFHESSASPIHGKTIPSLPSPCFAANRVFSFDRR